MTTMRRISQVYMFTLEEECTHPLVALIFLLEQNIQTKNKKR